MPLQAKLLARMLANPRGDWTIHDLQVVAKGIGLIVRTPSGGSHYTFSSPYLALHLTVPSRRPIKPPYIRKFTGLCAAHIAEEDRDG